MVADIEGSSRPMAYPRPLYVKLIFIVHPIARISTADFPEPPELLVLGNLAELLEKRSASTAERFFHVRAGAPQCTKCPMEHVR